MKSSFSEFWIGMPGAGKSTIGVMVAKEAAKDFVDTDVLIQVVTGIKCFGKGQVELGREIMEWLRDDRTNG